jgi:flagellar protein FlaJ
MNSSKSSPKRANKISFKPITPFELFYQLTFMSAMASAGITRSKLFELAEQCPSPAAQYFAAVNTLVDEIRLDYPDACRRVGLSAKSENIKSFLLRLSDALRSGEPMPEFLEREAEATGEDYQNRYERNLEGLKQWSNAFSSIVISVALIVIIQVISSMISSLNQTMMLGLVSSGVMMAGFGLWIIRASAPPEIMTVSPSKGSAEQRKAFQLFKLIAPFSGIFSLLIYFIGVDLGYILMLDAVFILPIGVISLMSDKKTNKKDEEFSTFLRSAGGTATNSGTTIKEALTKIDLSSFPTLEQDVNRLSKRLQALVDPEICWDRFGNESGSKLISEVVGIFYGAIKIGGDPERVGYLCSLFTAKTAQLRAKRRLNAGTFAGLSTVMHAVVAGLMVFVLSIVVNFANVVHELMPTGDAAADAQGNLNMGMATFTASDLHFLTLATMLMIIIMGLISALAVIVSDGGYKFKMAFYLSLILFISGICMIFVPPVVNNILTI